MPVTFTTPEQFVAQEFDYIVVGGGTAGLVVAARLSEDPNVTVGVLEAGGYFPDDPLINVPGYFGRNLGQPQVDWAYLTVPQKHVNGRPIFHPRGKLLGGTSALNFMAVGRATKEEYDAFETVGNEGWNWDEFLKYMKKSETVHEADNSHPELELKVDAVHHGTSGPIHNSYPGWISDLSSPFFQALESLGVKRNPYHGNGDPTGSYTILGTIDPSSAQRSYSASGYFAPNASRPNLVVLPYAQASKLILTGASEPYVVSGVQFRVGAGETEYIVRAKREVVLSTGSFGTPQLLELSGIGGREVLERFNIEVKVELPGVGENLQDHIYVATTYEVSNELQTFDVVRTQDRLASETALYEQGKGIFSTTHSAFAFVPVSTIAPPAEIARMKQELRNTAALTTNEAQRKQKLLLEEWFDDEKHPQIEIITYPGFFPAPGKTPKPDAHYQAVFVALMHPLSRGSVHITSSNSSDKASVDPQYLSSTVDRDLLVHALKFTKKIHDSAPLKGYTKSYVEPAWDWEMDAEGAATEDDEEELRDFLRSGMEPVYHPAGTAAMFARADGGVVDARLRVYGTTNLRVVDASVLPFHIAAHPTNTIYGIAEKASDLIKEDVHVLPTAQASWTPGSMISGLMSWFGGLY